jgi:hypothetical protein
MIRFKATIRAFAAVIPFVIAACSDPVGPSGDAIPANQNTRALLGLSSHSMHAVEWRGSHVDGTYTVSGVISPKGGTLSIPQADFSIRFEAGAVSAPTAVVITAVDGDYVSYDMQPHGIRFSAPVTVTQGLRNTEAYFNLFMIGSLVGAYIDNDTPPGPNGSFIASELLPSVTYVTRLLFGILVPDRQTWSLKHFSRYMLASG